MCGGSDPFQQLGNTLASIDPGPSIGGGLANLDKAVGNTIPGGWKTVGGAALLAAGIYNPELLAMADSGTLSEEALTKAGFDPSTLAQDINNLPTDVPTPNVPTPDVPTPNVPTPDVPTPDAPTPDTPTPNTPEPPPEDPSKSPLSELQKAKKLADLAKLGSSTATKTGLSALTGLGAGTAAVGAGLNAATTPTANTTKTYESPKATFVHGQQISVPGMTGTDIAPTPMQQMQAITPLDLQLIQQAKTGGMIRMAGGGDLPMQEARMRGKQFTTYRPHTGIGFAPGGEVEGHNPTFFSPGGLASMENTYVKGEGDGTSDSVAAMLADGEFVIPADVVSKLGNGSSDAGAQVLDNFLLTIREHAQKHDPKNLPPDSKGALAYLLDAKKKVRA